MGLITRGRGQGSEVLGARFLLPNFPLHQTAAMVCTQRNTCSPLCKRKVSRELELIGAVPFPKAGKSPQGLEDNPLQTVHQWNGPVNVNTCLSSWTHGKLATGGVHSTHFHAMPMWVRGLPWLILLDGEQSSLLAWWGRRVWPSKTPTWVCPTSLGKQQEKTVWDAD